MIKRIVIAIWEYLIKMNTGTNGKISINRNMAWGIATLMVVVQLYSLWRLPVVTDNQIALFIKLCITYVIVDASFVSLALGITSVEKLNELAKTIKGDFFKGNPPKEDKKPDEQQPQVIVNTQTEVTTQPQ